MLLKHKEVFFNAANRFNCWIGVRQPNELADRWIGKPGYIPKGENCKAKSADNATHPLAGLIVDPFLCPQAFKTKTLDQAKEKWLTKFLKGNKLPAEFSRTESGTEKGLVKFRERAIHADYDLMSLTKANNSGEMAFTAQQDEQKLFVTVARYLNAEFFTPMIQHGTEMLYSTGIGAWEEEPLLFFGPHKGFKIGHNYVFSNKSIIN